jgi:H+-transporting ATPase
MGLPKTFGPQSLGKLIGLSSAEAQRRLEQVGPNQVISQPRGSTRQLAEKFWGPAAGLLELAIVLELITGQALAGAVTGLVLAAHVLVAYLQEAHLQKILTFLAQHLSPSTQVFRDGIWQVIPAAGLVPGDVVYVQAGERAPADLRLVSGRIALDPAPIGEDQLAREAVAGDLIYAGSLLQRGEATGEITATGLSTAFGPARTPASIAHGPGHLQTLAARAVRYMAVFDGGLCVAALVFFGLTQRSLLDILPFGLILLLASLPVALPETLRLAIGLGAKQLADQGALVSRLSAIEDAAGLQVMCVDQSGTLTENRLRVARVKAYPPYGETDVLHLAAMASDEITQDPVDLAILEKMHTQGVQRSRMPRRSYTPSGPATRHSEAVYDEDGDDLRVIKGTPAAVLGLTGPGAQEAYADVRADINAISALDSRVIAVAVGTGFDPPHLAGLVALQDPLRPDSAGMVGRLHELGLKVVMVSSESHPVAQAVARQVGLKGELCSGTAAAVNVVDCDVYAEVLPPNKLELVRVHQQAGYRVGVTGDSLSDAPALQLAEVGVGVASASGSAPASASLTLARPGLANLVSALATSRQISSRMLAATLVKLANSLAIALVLSGGLILTGSFVLTPLLMALLLLSSDFGGMTLLTDTPQAPAQPQRWQMGALMRAAVGLALTLGAPGLVAVWFGQAVLHLAVGPLQTLVFVALAFSGQAALYIARERGAWWASRPGKRLVVGSVLVVLAIALMAGLGVLMNALPLGVIAGALAGCVGWMGVVGWIGTRI